MGIAAVGGAMVAIAGLVLALAAWFGVLPEQSAKASTPGRLAVWMASLRRARRATWLQLGGGLLLGVVLTYVMGWPVLLLVVPAAVVGLPRLLSDPPQHDLRLLEALDRWVRAMLAQLSTGKSITDAIRLSAKQPPKLLAEPLAVLVRRLDGRWTTPQALLAMADELGSSDADAVLAALILSAQRGGTGAWVTLDALADSIQERLKAMREIESERAKPRIVVRQVTGIMVIALVVFMVVSPEFFAPYGTPVGQVILLALLIAYVLSVWQMRRMTIARSRARILRALS